MFKFEEKLRSKDFNWSRNKGLLSTKDFQRIIDSLQLQIARIIARKSIPYRDNDIVKVSFYFF